jgi:hypothetical protein
LEQKGSMCKQKVLQMVTVWQCIVSACTVVFNVDALEVFKGRICKKKHGTVSPRRDVSSS